jgi:phosphoglycolate phosphatase-like HAD superfamily hydrolase
MKSKKRLSECLGFKKALFLDFDGVIKKSNLLKEQAYLDLFYDATNEALKIIMLDLRENPGISRYNRIPKYFEIVFGVTPNESDLNKLCEKYSDIVSDKVIDAEWVDGAKEFLKNNFEKFKLILISATPQQELREITKAIGIDKFFHGIHGAPSGKSKVLNEYLRIFPKKACLFIGDSPSDKEAATENGIEFLWLKHLNNESSIGKLDSYIENFE